MSADFSTCRIRQSDLAVQINVSAFDGAKKPEEDVNFKKTFPIFINT